MNLRRDDCVGTLKRDYKLRNRVVTGCSGILEIQLQSAWKARRRAPHRHEICYKRPRPGEAQPTSANQACAPGPVITARRRIRKLQRTQKNGRTRCLTT